MQTPPCRAPQSYQTSAPAPPLPLPLLCGELKTCVGRPQPALKTRTPCVHLSCFPLMPACTPTLHTLHPEHPTLLASLMPQSSFTPPLVCTHLLVPRPILTFVTDMAAASMPQTHPGPK